MVKKDVRTLEDLVVFANLRAKKSARRNDPIAWAYWKDVSEWAHAAVGLWPHNDPAWWPAAAADYFEAAKRASTYDAREAARCYSRAKWIRIMAVNKGLRTVRPLSLKWMHDMEFCSAEAVK